MPRNADVTMRIAENSHHYVHRYCTDDECRELHIPEDNADTNEYGQHEIHTDNGAEIYHLSAVSCEGSVRNARHNYSENTLYYRDLNRGWISCAPFHEQPL